MEINTTGKKKRKKKWQKWKYYNFYTSFCYTPVTINCMYNLFCGLQVLYPWHQRHWWRQTEMWETAQNMEKIVCKGCQGRWKLVKLNWINRTFTHKVLSEDHVLFSFQLIQALVDSGIFFHSNLRRLDFPGHDRSKSELGKIGGGGSENYYYSCWGPTIKLQIILVPKHLVRGSPYSSVGMFTVRSGGIGELSYWNLVRFKLGIMVML